VARWGRGQNTAAGAAAGDKPQSSGEMDELKRQLDEMQKRIEKLGGKE
jgi:polyhydroxyalkanoate synthesis regulator protein